MKYDVKDQLHPATADMLDCFSVALRRKLYQAQVKYGYTDDWKKASPDVLRAALMEHIGKGDPLDVAAFCAFLWHHKESTMFSHDFWTDRRAAAFDNYMRASQALGQEL